MDLKSLRIPATAVIICLVSGFAIVRNTPETATDKETLGRLLFFEKALSLDSSISCASCHKPEFAFADTVPFSTGVGDRKGLRNTPSVMNMAGRDLLFYDGRAGSLAEQVHFPIEDPNEMRVPYAVVIDRLNADPRYRGMFIKIYGRPADSKNLSDAVAAYELSLETSNTPFDDYMSGKSVAYPESAIRGRELFLSDRTKCFDCHFGPDFTGDEFRNIGLYDGVRYQDKGRYNISQDSADIGKFKVPGLRNVAVTGPYMHDGSFKTLEQVIEYYSNPYATVGKPINMDSTLRKPLNLSATEKADLLSFLQTLTDRRFTNR